MFLNDLLNKAGIAHQTTALVSLEQLAFDSRQNVVEALFVAIPCPEASIYVKEAIAQGARAVLAEAALCQKLAPLYPAVPFIPHPHPRLALSKLAAAYWPLQPETNVAVTGTNGKSSTVSFLRQLWQGQGYQSASMGTLGLDTGSQRGMMAALKFPSLTTPDAVSLHQALHLLASHGINHCAFEATSHGLHQYRLHGVNLAAAGWTNLTHDHLDYHQTLDKYFAAKLKLIQEILPPGKPVVINRTTAFFELLAKAAHSRNQNLLTYAVESPAFLEARNIKVRHQQLHFTLWLEGKNLGTHFLNMSGTFQIENLLCALGLAMVSLKVDAANLLPLLPSLQSVPGRMEFVGKVAAGGLVFVDYSHKPDALKRALESLRLQITGKLWVVFGCGGDRDKEKRGQMGKIAASFADEVIVTDDNPRNEEPEAIRQAILRAAPQAKEIPGRAQAITTAMQALAANDGLLVAGKGHEQGQIVKDQVFAFDDRQQILRLLQAGV